MTNIGASVALRAAVDVFAAFTDIATWLRSQERISAVDNSCWMDIVERTSENSFSIGKGNGLSIKWAVDADFDFECDLNFTVEVTWDGSAWVIEGSARGYSRDGEDVLVELPTIDALDDKSLVAGMGRMTDGIQGVRQEALDRFMGRYGDARTIAQ